MHFSVDYSSSSEPRDVACLFSIPDIILDSTKLSISLPTYRLWSRLSRNVRRPGCGRRNGVQWTKLRRRLDRHRPMVQPRDKSNHGQLGFLRWLWRTTRWVAFFQPYSSCRGVASYNPHPKCFGAVISSTVGCSQATAVVLLIYDVGKGIYWSNGGIWISFSPIDAKEMSF